MDKPQKIPKVAKVGGTDVTRQFSVINQRICQLIGFICILGEKQGAGGDTNYRRTVVERSQRT